MPLSSFLPLIIYGFVSSITPGPNNFMLLASGVNFGFRRSIPHILGIGAGFLSLMLGVGFGLGALLSAFPPLHLLLKIVGGAYLLYLAWKIASSRTLGSAKETRPQPMTFLQAAAFQWVNVKAWVMAIGAMSIYANPDAPFVSAVLIASTVALVNLPCVSTWAGCGVALRGFLADPVRLKWFNIAMGLMLAATLWPMLQ
ncbi:LysE family translocator [Tianweitania sp. BSSL-BM11]|uniref:LysE family translocator n=1 Tax=Tianweitania aestuarii TaxID=2814886 RepID=A0ABS5RV32_9HYPH|nr:LysE family translocator [Tianweitania aestuarii]MBS9720866.1 LysE family translocator [Tianweitania aestuarii]